MFSFRVPFLVFLRIPVELLWWPLTPLSGKDPDSEYPESGA